jgi:acyl carrier protein
MTKIARPDVLALLYECISELNEMLPSTSQLALKEETVLLADVGGLDSLGMVNFVSAIEEKVQQRFGITIMITVAADSPSASDPWRNVGALTDFVLGHICSSGA